MYISAPNYTQTPNICYDELFKTLKEGELRIVLVLIRQTFGWHKSSDQISLGQLSYKTGMDKRSICRSLKSLLEKGLIIKNKFGENGSERCYYSLVTEKPTEENIDEYDEEMCDEEKELISNNSYQCLKVTPPQGLKVTPPSDLMSPTKETPKETVQKKQQQPVAVFSCLENILIDQQEKEWLTNTYSEMEVQHAVKYATSPHVPIKTSLIQAIKWACKRLPEIPKSPEQKEDENKKLAKEVFENAELPKDCQMNILNKCVEICFNGNSEAFILNYSEPNFKVRLKEALKKYRISPK